MKKVLALFLCLLMLVGTIPTFMASADIEGRVLQEFTVKGSVNGKTLTGDGYVAGPSSFLKDAADLSGYALKDLALEVDLYLEGDMTAFKKSINAWVEVTSSGGPDSEELNWNIGAMEWQTDKWFRLTLKFSEAGKSGTIDLSKVNYTRMYVYSSGGVGKTYTFKYCNFRIVDLSKGATGTDPIGDGTFKVTDPTWELVDTEYPTTEAIIAGYNLGDYMQPNTGADATGALQTLLDAMGSKGGGTVFVPSGRWTFKGSLEIPYGVTLQGDWRAPTDENPEAVGTIFEVYGGKGNVSGNSFIVQLPNSCVQGITFWYPEQDPENIVPYPMTIQKYKAGNWGADYTHVRNCTFVNSYIAVQQPAGSGCPNVYNVYGTPLYLGVFLDNVADIGRTDYIHFAAKYWEKSGLPGAPATDAQKKAVADYLYENATGLLVGRVDWSYWCFADIEGYKTGIHFIESKADPGAYANGQVYGMTFTGCHTAIRVDGIGGAGELFSNITIKDCAYGLYTTSGNQQDIGNMQMNHMTIDADTAIAHGGSMRIFINDFTIQRGGVELAGGPMTISSSTFETAAPHVTMKSGASCAIFQANKATNGEFKVDNTSMSPIEFSDTPVVMEEIDWMTAEQAKDDTVKAAREVLYVADFDKTGKTDVTAKLQALLDKAGQEGGGYVFLPGGFYRLNNGVTVPSGVELCGATDIGRAPYRIGTILEVCGMRGDATITLSANSGIRAIVFDYPEQGNSPETLKAYPTTILGKGENVYIVNVAIRNGFDGIDLMTNRCDNHYIKYLAGYCFHSVIKVGGGSVGGKIINYQMNSSAWWSGYESKYGSWPNSPTPSDHTENTGGAWKLNNIYVQTNCAILTVGDVTDQVLYDNFSYLGAMGAYYVEENGKGANGWNVGNAYDYTSVGIKIDGIGDMDFINVQIVSYNYTEQVPDTHHVYLTDKCDDNVTIINLACWAQPDNFLRVDSGSLNVYCADFNDNAKSGALTKIGEKGKLYMQNGTSPNGGVKILATENLKNLTMSGYINEFGLTGESECNWGTNMVRVLRWDVPQNATIDKTQKMVFTEGFGRYKTETVGNIANALSKDGSFNVLPTNTDNGNVTLAIDNEGNEMMRLFHTGATQSVYARNSSLRLKSGRANNLYMLETRLNVKSLRDANKANFTLTMYNMNGANPSGAVDLVSFKPDGVYVGEQKLTDKVTDIWYRVQVEFDLTGTSGKTYTVRLLDDEYKVVAEAKNVALPAACQGNKNDLGTLSLVASATRTDDDKITEVLVDYLFVQQDPTVVSDPIGMLGDVDGDGSITSTDARLTLQFYAGKIGEVDLNVALADVDGDDSITSTDARLILQKYAGKIEAFPAEA